MSDTTAPPKPDAAPFTPRASEPPELAAVTDELRERLAPRIQLLEKLGEGGMGVVFLGRDPMLHRSVAIKVLAPALASDAKAQDRFTREAQAAAAIPHPHVVSIYEVGDLPRTGLSYFVMQLVEGDSLATLHGGQTLPAPAIRRIAGEVASALAAAHARSLIHRDIKPANIMIERASGRAIVLDFGIAAVLEDQPRTPGDPATSTGGTSAARAAAVTGAIGTPSHISPEQARGQRVTDKTDVYSLGIVAFELATGRWPFMERTPLAMLHAHLKQTPPRVHDLRPELDERLASLIDRCLSKDPDERPSAAEVARSLRPGMETAIEWPPPGLTHLRDTGRRLFASLRALTLCFVAFFLAVYAQPQLATVSWRQGETSPFWRTLWTPYTSLQSFATPLVDDSSRLSPPSSLSPFDATPLWYFMVLAAGIASLAAAGVVARRTFGLTKESRVARDAGYPWRVVAAVAADAGPDTADLVNGLGRYALLDGGERDRLLRLRRLESFSILLSALFAFLLPFVWLSVAPTDGGGATQWLTDVEMLLLATPLVLLLVAFALRLPERRARRHGPRARGRNGAMPVVRRELVDAWVATASSMSALPRSVPRVLLLRLPPILSAGVLLLVVAATTGISAFSIWSSPTLRDSVDAWRDGRASPASPASPVRWAALVMADPRDSSGIAEIRDRGNAPTVRLELLRGVVDGYCYNGRERLFGVSPLRRALLESAAQAARDLRGIESIIARERTHLADVLALGGVLGVAARSRACPAS